MLVVVGPLGKLDLADQHGVDSVATFHYRRRNSETPSAFASLRQIYKRTRRGFEFLKLFVEIR
jgi:hypothetical protein